MANVGVAPLDPTAAVGQLRLLLGDVSEVDLVPAVAGQGNYGMFSDADLGSFLAAGYGNINRAAGHAYTRIASTFAMQSATAKAQDMAVDLTKRAEQFTALAKLKYDLADQDDLTGRNPAGAVAIVLTPSLRPTTFSPYRTPFLEEIFGQVTLPIIATPAGVTSV